MRYSEKLKHPKWQKKRLEILNRDNFTCVYCGDKETTLHVHHKKYFGEPHEALNEYLETVCEDCHSLIEEIDSVYKIIEKINLLKIIKIKNEYSFLLCFCVPHGSLLVSKEDEYITRVYINKGELKLILNTINNA